ncbi:hypothetical protein [Streptomyces sp. NPDC059072]|uniref:hypothetical protein n=1 Tax=Streptomyces sp. NPDC059072 TaxID=3346715 RepID=UPI0036807E5F
MTVWHLGTTVMHTVVEAEVAVPVAGALRTDGTALGHPSESIDTVVRTHLHFDHGSR